MTLGSKASPFLGFKARGELEQFGLEVLDGIRPVLVRPLLRERILEVIERRPHSPGDVKTPGNTHRAYGVKPVTVLKDAGLKCQRFESCRVTVCFDRRSCPGKWCN